MHINTMTPKATERISVEQLNEKMENKMHQEESRQESHSFKFVERGLDPNYIPSFYRR